jgi:hypothetical protein
LYFLKIQLDKKVIVSDKKVIVNDLLVIVEDKKVIVSDLLVIVKDKKVIVKMIKCFNINALNGMPKQEYKTSINKKDKQERLFFLSYFFFLFFWSLNF